MRQLAARTDAHPGQADESWLCWVRSKKTRLLLGSRRGSYRPAGRGRGAEGEPRRRRAARLGARHTGRLRPLRRARPAGPPTPNPRRKSPPLTSYQLRHLPDPARDVGRQHGEVLLVALEVGGHGGGAGGGRGPAALRGDRRAQPGALQPFRTQALPRSATCKGVPPPPPGSSPQVPAKLSARARVLEARPRCRPSLGGSNCSPGPGEGRRRRRPAHAPQPGTPQLPAWQPRSFVGRAGGGVVGWEERGCGAKRRDAVSRRDPIANGPPGEEGGRRRLAEPEAAVARAGSALPPPPRAGGPRRLPFLPLPLPLPHGAAPASAAGGTARGWGRREPCAAAAAAAAAEEGRQRQRAGGGSGHGRAGGAAAGAAPVPLGASGGPGRGGRVLRHRHGGRRAVVLAPGHRRGKRQLHHAPQLDRHDPLQLLQRHVCRPGVRPSGVDAGKRWMAMASSPGWARRGGGGGLAGLPALVLGPAPREGGGAGVGKTAGIAYLPLPPLPLSPRRRQPAPQAPPSSLSSLSASLPLCCCFQRFQCAPVYAVPSLFCPLRWPGAERPRRFAGSSRYVLQVLLEAKQQGTHKSC